MMTKLAYLEDCYKKELNTAVIEASGNEIILEETILYPAGGGQPNDTGIIERNKEHFKVLDVKKENGKAIHIVDREGLQAGDKIHVKVDWERRYRIMRYHTATHVLCAVICNETGAEITGNQLSDEKTRIDFNLETFDREKLKDYERKANQIIKEGHKVLTMFLPREEALKIPGVVKLANALPPNVKELRLVDITGVDQQACGGTHLKNTSEIGEIEIIKADNKGKNNRRLTFVIKP